MLHVMCNFTLKSRGELKGSTEQTAELRINRVPCVELCELLWRDQTGLKSLSLRQTSSSEIPPSVMCAK